MPNMSWLRESSTYQAILAEGEARGEARGRLDEARQLLLTLGTEKFGPPDQGITTTLERLEDRGELEILHRRLLTAANWPELLAAEPDR
jgi:predicted transposase YdaD